MDSARWDRVQSLFHGVADRPAVERRARLEASCVDDPTLVDDVLALVDYTYVMTITELAVLYNGQQIQTVRESSLTFTGITMNGGVAGAAAGAPGVPNDTGENIKKATDAIRGILGGKKK